MFSYLIEFFSIAMIPVLFVFAIIAIGTIYTDWKVEKLKREWEEDHYNDQF